MQRDKDSTVKVNIQSTLKEVNDVINFVFGFGDVANEWKACCYLDGFIQYFSKKCFEIEDKIWNVFSLYYLRDGPPPSGAKSPSLSLVCHLHAKIVII